VCAYYTHTHTHAHTHTHSHPNSNSLFCTFGYIHIRRSVLVLFLRTSLPLSLLLKAYPFFLSHAHTHTLHTHTRATHLSLFALSLTLFMCMWERECVRVCVGSNASLFVKSALLRTACTARMSVCVVGVKVGGSVVLRLRGAEKSIQSFASRWFSQRCMCDVIVCVNIFWFFSSSQQIGRFVESCCSSVWKQIFYSNVTIQNRRFSIRRNSYLKTLLQKILI